MNSCTCGKKRSDLNSTNWTRHVQSCEKRKLSCNINSDANDIKTKKITFFLKSCELASYDITITGKQVCMLI